MSKPVITLATACHPRVKMSCLCGTVRWMPLILCVLTPVSILLTYGIAVGRGDVVAFLPYISDTGTKPPESCIFGLLLSAVSFLLCAIIYIRYREVSEWAKLNPSVGITPTWNRAASFFGVVSALGLHMVANFQELNEFATHIIGAMMCFFSGIAYFFLQTEFTRRMRPQAKCMLWLRLVLTLCNVLFVVGTLGLGAAAMKDFKGKDFLKWTPKDGGFTLHILSTSSEWLLVFSFCAYICTLFWEFRELEIEPVRIKFKLKEEPQTESEGTDEGTGKGMWI